MTAGEKIYEARKRAGMTQEELADKLGVSRQAVSKWESDAAFPETDKIIELCKMFGLSADVLLGAEQKGAEEENGSGQTASDQGAVKERWHFEYVSKTRLRGLPLVHINFGLGAYRAKGIVAVGNFATGFLSLGLISVGLLSAGVLAFGLLAFGTVAFALLLGAGTVATGALAFGGVAIGILCFGGLSIGYIGIGGMAIGQYAMGGAARGFVAVGSTWASGTHAFVMPAQYEELCVYVDSAFHGGIGNLIKGIALNLGN